MGGLAVGLSAPLGQKCVWGMCVDMGLDLCTDYTVTAHYSDSEWMG